MQYQSLMLVQHQVNAVKNSNVWAKRLWRLNGKFPFPVSSIIYDSLKFLLNFDHFFWVTGMQNLCRKNAQWEYCNRNSSKIRNFCITLDTPLHMNAASFNLGLCYDCRSHIFLLLSHILQWLSNYPILWLNHDSALNPFNNRNILWAKTVNINLFYNEIDDRYCKSSQSQSAVN